MNVLICVTPALAKQWAGHVRPSFGLLPVYSGKPLVELEELDAIFSLFHLAERLGFDSAEGRAVVHEYQPNAGQRRIRVITSPRLRHDKLADARGVIERFIHEALAAAVAHNESMPERSIATLGFWHDDLGRELPITERAAAIDAAIESFRTLMLDT